MGWGGGFGKQRAPAEGGNATYVRVELGTGVGGGATLGLHLPTRNLVTGA